MSEPKTPLGRILDEQARQDIPEDLEGWTQVLNRLQAEKVTTSRPALHISLKDTKQVEEKMLKSENDVDRQNSGIKEQAKSSPIALKRRRGLALAGLGMAAVLALFLIAASVFLSGEKGPKPVVSDATKGVQTSQAALAGVTTTPIALTAASTPYVAPSLDYAPQDCGPAPVLQELSPNVAAMAGGNPVGMVGVDKQGQISLYEARPTQWGYAQKVLWAISPTYTGTVSIQGSNLKTGRPLWFQTNSKPVTTLSLDTSDYRVQKQGGWYFWPSELYAPEAGCYRIAATWPGGSWTITLGAGKATIPNSTPLPTATPGPQSIPGLTVNSANFSKQGKLAFVFNGNLLVLDGETGQTYQLTKSGGVNEFKWSYNGEWLAYKVLSVQTNTAWVTHYDGIGYFKLPGSGEFAWSPVKNEIALAGTDDNPGLQIVNTTANAHLIGVVNVNSPLWSPDGSTIAFVSSENGVNGPAKIVTMPAIGGSPTTYFTGKAGDGMKLVGWWPNGKGLLFQTIPANSASLSMDGLPVQSLGLVTPNALPQQLVKSLVNIDWLSWSPDGSKFVAVEGSGRQVSSNKSLTVCDITKLSCHGIVQPANTVSLDPAWSPDGTLIAFVRAADQNIIGDQASYANWLKTNTIWVVKPDGSNIRQVNIVGAQNGLRSPLWSADGKKLLLSQSTINGQDALWLVELPEKTDQLTANAEKIASPIRSPFGFNANSDLYGFVAWFRN